MTEAYYTSLVFHQDIFPKYFNERYYKINKFLLSCYGQWVYQTKAKQFLGRSLIFFSIMTTLFIQFRFLFSVWGNDVDATLECLPPLTLIIMCFCQLCTYTFNEKKLLMLVTSIRNDWKLWSSGMEKEILRSYGERGRNYTLLYAGYIYVAVFTFVAMSMTPIVLNIIIPLNESRPNQLVYPARYPWDHDKNINWTLIHGSVSAFYHLSALFCFEAMLAVTTEHASGLFAIVSYRLKNALKLINSDPYILQKNKKEFLYREMSYSIRYHSYAIRYANVLESIYSPFLFFTIGGNIITTCVLLLQVLNSLGNMIDLFKFGPFAISLFLHIYVLSLPAQTLLDNSVEVANEAYQESWYDMPEKSKKLLCMIFMQSGRPCKLTAGKVATIDMITFSKILKMTLSSFTMLSSLR